MNLQPDSHAFAVGVSRVAPADPEPKAHVPAMGWANMVLGRRGGVFSGASRRVWRGGFASGRRVLVPADPSENGSGGLQPLDSWTCTPFADGWWLICDGECGADERYPCRRSRGVRQRKWRGARVYLLRRVVFLQFDADAAAFRTEPSCGIQIIKQPLIPFDPKERLRHLPHAFEASAVHRDYRARAETRLVDLSHRKPD